MGVAIGYVVPCALGVAASPIRISAVVLMLSTPTARNAWVFVAAFILGLSGAAVAVWLTGWEIPDSSSGGLLQLGLGVALLGLAAGQWTARRRGDALQPPGWMRSVDRLTTPRAAATGLLFSAANPKNLGLTIAVAAGIAGAGLSPTGEVSALAAFVVLASLPMLVPIAATVVFGSGASAMLERVRHWLVAHGHTVILVVFVVIGLELVVVGGAAIVA